MVVVLKKDVAFLLTNPHLWVCEAIYCNNYNRYCCKMKEKVLCLL